MKNFLEKSKSVFYTSNLIDFIKLRDYDIKFLNNKKNLLNKKSRICLHKNDIARIKIKTTTPFFFDAYRKNRNTGSFILIDENSLNTVGAGMINN